MKPASTAARLTVREALREPQTAARRMAGASGFGDVPWRTWTFLGLFAVVASLVYGGSLSLAAPHLSGPGGAAWLTLAAGLSWPALGLALLRWGRVPILAAAQVCLVTMSYGVTVLLVGALLNAALGSLNVAPTPALVFNGAWVMLSNLIMVTLHSEQLGALGLSRARSVALWMLGLNLPGALFAWLFLPMLLMGA